MPRFRRKFDFSGGVNLLDDPRNLADNEWVELKNIVPIGQGRYGKRGALHGFLATGLTVNADPHVFKPYRLIELPWDPGTFAYIYYSNEVDATSANITVAGTAFTADSKAGQFQVVPTGPLALLSFNDRVLAFLGENSWVTGHVVSKGPTGTPHLAEFVFAGTGNAGLRPRVVFPYRRRLVYCNFGQGYENYVIMSNDDDPETIGNDAINTLAEIVGARDADHIVAGVEVMLQGASTPAQSAALILKQYSCYFITGEAGQASLTGNDMEIVRLNTEAGCASQATAVNTPHGVIWAGHENVWLFVAGSLPIPLGNKIAKRLKETPADKRYLWHAEYFNGFYRLAIMSPGQGPDDFSPCGEQWWLDLRTGVPQNWKEAKWFGPQVFKQPWGKLGLSITPGDAEVGTHCMYTRRIPNHEPKLFGLAMPTTAFPSPETTREFYIVGFDGLDLADNTLKGVGVSGEMYYQYDTEISIRALSKVFTEGEVRYKKMLDSVELDIEPLNQVLITCDILKNGQTSVQTVSAVVARQDDTILGGDIVEMNVPLGLASQRTVLSNGSGTRQVAYDWQIQVSDLIGYYVKSGENVMTFSRGGFTYNATVAVGSYDNIYELYEAIIAAMNTAIGSSIFSHNIGALPENYSAKPAITASSGVWKPIGGVVWDTCGIPPAEDPDPPALTWTADNDMPWSKASEFYLYGGMIRGSVIPREP